MTPELVDKHLENYREYSARCTFLEEEIKELQELKRKLENTAISDAVHITSVMTGMPHGTEITDPTGRIAIQFADGFKPEHIKQIDEEIRKLEAERRAKISTVIFVNAWLKVLTEREMYIVENKVIGGMVWRDLIAGYNAKFGVMYSKSGMKNLKDAAMEKIYKVAE